MDDHERLAVLRGCKDRILELEAEVERLRNNGNKLQGETIRLETEVERLKVKLLRQRDIGTRTLDYSFRLAAADAFCEFCTHMDSFKKHPLLLKWLEVKDD